MMAKPSSLVTFCAGLKSRLPTSRDSAAVEALEADLATHLRAAEAQSQKVNPGVRKYAADLDGGGTELWNLCTKLRRELETSGDGSDCGVTRAKRRLLARCRYFAFLLIDIARRSLSEKKRIDGADAVHLVRLALKAGRSCVDTGELRASLGALQRAGDYIDEIKGCGDDDVEGEVRKLEVEYFILRTLQAWKEDRLDVSEHMLRNAGDLLTNLDATLAESLADTFFDIGRTFLSKKEFFMATKWLERAYEVIDGQAIDRLSRDGVELRLTILQAYIQALVGTKTRESLSKAENLVAYVETDMGDKPVLLLLRLELLRCVPSEEFDSLAYECILHRMVKSFNFTEEHFMFVLRHARWLHDRSATLGCSVMDDLIATRILPSGKGEWIEKALVLRVFMATSQSGIVENCIELADLLAKVKESLAEPMKPMPATAAQSLLWKQVEATLRDDQLEMTDRWCRLVMHEVFSPAGQQNLIKAARKRIYCALMRNEFDNAKVLYTEMSEAGKNEPMTKYLMFKVAIRSDDAALAVECLESLSRPALEAHEFLYAAILDAQTIGSKTYAVEAMKTLVERYEFGNSAPVHLPALIRCTIRLRLMDLNADKDIESSCDDAVIDDICRMFEIASESTKKDLRDEKDNKMFTVQELNWFSHNSYSLGRQYCEIWGMKNTIRIFTSCLNMISQYPTDIPANDAKDNSLKAMCCHFVIAAAFISLARTEDALEERQKRYKQLRTQVAGFDGEFQTRTEAGLDPEVLADLLGKLATLLIFDFEGAVALQQWDCLREIVTKAAACEDAAAYKAMADCLLRASDVPGRVMFSTMRGIINRLSALDDMGAEKVTKYIRCLFQMVLPLEGGMAFQLADEALQLARESTTTGRAFPDEELQWLATMSWNHAIDLYQADRDGECKKWCAKAIDLAHYCSDEGVLEGSLQGRFTTLKWEAG